MKSPQVIIALTKGRILEEVLPLFEQSIMSKILLDGELPAGALIKTPHDFWSRS